MRKAIVLAAVVLCATPIAASAFDRLVNPHGTCPPAQVGGAPQHATIQDAVTLSVPGDEIGICPGTYEELVTIPVIKVGISLTGIGKVVVEPPADEIGGMMVLADGVLIQRLDIRGFEAAAVFVDADDVTLRNNDIHGNLEALTITGDRHRVRNNIIRVVGEFALLAHEINGVEISGNRISGGNLGIAASGVDKTSPGTVIHHNLLTGPLGGIGISDAEGGTIRNNTVRGALADGITVSDTRGVAIVQNLVQGSRGIQVHDSEGCAVAFNSATLNLASGLRLTQIDGCTIARNNASRNESPDCFWDGSGTNTFSRNACATEDPAGAFD
jgi:parallel beta-helix repeat protein